MTIRAWLARSTILIGVSEGVSVGVRHSRSADGFSGLVTQDWVFKLSLFLYRIIKVLNWTLPLIFSCTQAGAFTARFTEYYLVPFLIEQTLYHDFVSVHIYCVPSLFTLRRHQDPMHGTMEQKILDSSPPSSPPTERPRK